MIPFIDISSYQEGPVGIDWAAVARWLTDQHPEAGVIIKVSEGTDYINPFLHQQRMGAHAAGIRNVGLYHYGKPSHNTGHDEANYFMWCVGSDGGVLRGEFPCLDEEDKDVGQTADLDDYTLDYHDPIERAWGTASVNYTGRWYADPHNLNRDPRLAKLGLWWSVPGTSKELVAGLVVPEPWKSAGKGFLLVQTDFHGAVPGIQGEVDLDWLVSDTIDVLRPYQWGLWVDPLAGIPIDTQPDVPIDPHSENLTDARMVVQKIASDAEEGYKLSYPGSPVSKILATIKADADLVTRITWGH